MPEKKHKNQRDRKIEELEHTVTRLNHLLLKLLAATMALNKKGIITDAEIQVQYESLLKKKD